MSELNEKEKIIKEKLDEIELMPFEEKFSQIESQLENRDNQNIKKKNSFLSRRFLSIAASILVICFSSLAVFFAIKPNNTDAPPLTYMDDNIATESCTLEDLTSVKDIYLPNLKLLEINTISIGKHVETGENIFFIMTGIHENEESFREVEIAIVLKKEYFGNKVKDFSNLNEKLDINGTTINFKEFPYEEPFYRYYVSCQKNDIRYYFVYKTIEKNDLSNFFGELLI